MERTYKGYTIQSPDKEYKRKEFRILKNEEWVLDTETLKQAKEWIDNKTK